MKRRTFELLLLATLSSGGALGQINCSSGPSSQKLVCQFPFSTGALTFDTALYGNLKGGVQSALQAAGVFNNAIATQVSQLPLASASAGTVVIFKQGVPETFDNLGPILTDRAQTVGKHRLFIGGTASQFVFTDIDGVPLGKLPFAYTTTAFSPKTGAVLSNTYTSEYTAFEFKLNQFIGVATYGLTSRTDVSVIVPIERISIGATTFGSRGYIFNADNVFVYGPFTNPNTHTPGTASGVGDITFNAKTEIWRGEHATVSGAMNFRVPTGDDQNYLGSGAWGFNPYIVYSYLWKVAPHVKIGYEWNTKTELNNPTDTAGGNQNLPGGLQYDVGADYAMVRHVTVAADLLGSQYLNAPRLVPTPVTLPAGSPISSLPTIATENASYSLNNVSAGLKWNPYRNLVLSGNVLFQLNNNGLRSRPTPLVGISYKF
jgi:hypothetical protein